MSRRRTPSSMLSCWRRLVLEGSDGVCEMDGRFSGIFVGRVYLDISGTWQYFHDIGKFEVVL
jgi:hypothetical protein